MAGHRIKMMISVLVPLTALISLANQITSNLLLCAVKVGIASAAHEGMSLDSQYEGLLAEDFCVDGGTRTEEDVFTAVGVSTMSDSGVSALHSRLSTFGRGCGPKRAIISLSIKGIVSLRLGYRDDGVGFAKKFWRGRVERVAWRRCALLACVPKRQVVWRQAKCDFSVFTLCGGAGAGS